MRYFFFKLNPPRTNFAVETTPEEQRLMQQHVEYWREEVRRYSVFRCRFELTSKAPALFVMVTPTVVE